MGAAKRVINPDIEAYESRAESRAAAAALAKTRQRTGVRLLLYLVAGGFAFSGAIVLVKPLVPCGDYDPALKEALTGWVGVAEFEVLRKIMYYSVGCTSLVLWCLMFMNRLSLSTQAKGHRRVFLDLLSSMIDLAVWMSLWKVVLVCSEDRPLPAGVCEKNEGLCEVVLGELWFRQRMGVICAQMVGLIHFVLFIGLFPETLFEIFALIRGTDQEKSLASRSEDQRLAGPPAPYLETKPACAIIFTPPGQLIPSEEDLGVDTAAEDFDCF